MKFLPVPVVWSPEGPVLLLGVAPDLSLHSKLTLKTFFFSDQWGQDPSKSKSQSKGPANNNNRNQSKSWANNYIVTCFLRRLLSMGKGSFEVKVTIKRACQQQQSQSVKSWFKRG